MNACMCPIINRVYLSVVLQSFRSPVVECSRSLDLKREDHCFNLCDVFFFIKLDLPVACIYIIA